MATVQWRVEVNALTTPQSYRIIFVPRNSVGNSDLAARMAKALPNYSEEEFSTFLATRIQIIQEGLINGEQLTEENAFSYSLSFTGRLEHPDDPLPPLDECLHVRVRVLPAFVEGVFQKVQTERRHMNEKRPLVNAAKDSLLELKDVLNPIGALQLTGTDLFFDRKLGTGSCVIAGTKNGSIVQTRFIKIETSEIILMPEIPEQDSPWNNEYTVSISTRYSEHGTLRTSTYNRKLRTPLAWDGLPHEGGIGVLTGNADVPYVTIESGTISANETLRIQVILDQHEDRLLVSLLDMNENGIVGAELAVTANGNITLQGFSGSAVSSMSLIVHEYAALKELLHNSYQSRMVDIVQIELV